MLCAKEAMRGEESMRGALDCRRWGGARDGFGNEIRKFLRMYRMLHVQRNRIEFLKGQILKKLTPVHVLLVSVAPLNNPASALRRLQDQQS